MTTNFDKNENNISKILVAVDGSKSSIDAADYAIDLTRKNNSQLIVVYVIDPYKYPYLLSSTIFAPTYGNEKYHEEKKQAEELMEKIKEKYIQITKDSQIKNLKICILDGKMSVALSIVEEAELEHVDLIIVGSKGKTGFKRMLIGSVSLDVVKYAHCSVLIKR